MNAPADPNTTTVHPAAKLAVYVLSALIILALIAIVTGVALKMTGHSAHLIGNGSGASTEDGATFVLPHGARVLSSETQPGRLVLHVQSTAGDEIDIVNLDDGHLVARIASAPK